MFVAFIVLLNSQARPEGQQPCDQDEDEEEKENEEDLTVPGFSYIKLVGLTPRPVLPGTIISNSGVQIILCVVKEVCIISLKGENLALLKHRHTQVVC